MRSYDFARLWRSTIGFDRLLDVAEAAQRAGEDKTEKVEREFLWHGVSTRTFKRQLNLADYVQVKSAAFDNGLLKID
jgi:molecular chaperone IbpA